MAMQLPHFHFFSFAAVTQITSLWTHYTESQFFNKPNFNDERIVRLVIIRTYMETSACILEIREFFYAFCKLIKDIKVCKLKALII